MARAALLALSAGTLSIVAASQAIAAPLSRSGGAAAAAASTILPPPKPVASAAASSVEVPPPDLPAPVSGLGTPTVPGPTGFVTLAARSGGSDPWTVPPSAMQAILAQPVALRVSLPPEAATDGSAPAAAGQMVEREVASHDASLSRLNVLPPPRPAFLAARVAHGRGILELKSRDGATAWSEIPLAGTPSAVASLSGRPERTISAGVASWYGPGFHGRKTASGERFDQNALTAAHRTLPFGTKVRVVDERTGRSIVVRINDRGPFSHGRVIDLSKASAEALGMGGLARVKVVSAE